MPIGKDEKLMSAINTELVSYRSCKADDAVVRAIAERLHECYPHRPVDQIERRMRLMLSQRGSITPQ